MTENRKKTFLITIDTEADNQWDLSHGITTENARFLPRFQELCEKYHFKPVWLVNYEMAMDDFLVGYMKEKQKEGLCEVGMHLHAWHTPPEYPLERQNNHREYLIEYPKEIMEEKIKTMTELLEERFEKRPKSHRSGRWTMDAYYFALLEKYGYVADCSVTPHFDWSKHTGATECPGSDYSDAPETPYNVGENLLEVPLTVRKIHCFQPGLVYNLHSFLSECRKMVTGRYQWLRPDNLLSNKGNLKLVDAVSAGKSDYAMFMIHSSELMPGGSPTFQTESSIERLYGMTEEIFDKITALGYRGKTLEQYCQDKYQIN